MPERHNACICPLGKGRFAIGTHFSDETCIEKSPRKSFHQFRLLVPWTPDQRLEEDVVTRFEEMSCGRSHCRTKLVRRPPRRQSACKCHLDLESGAAPCKVAVAGSHGKVNRTHVPRPASLVIVTKPPCNSTMRLTSAKPSPTRPDFVVRAASDR